MSRYLSWIDDGDLGDLLGRAGARAERATTPAPQRERAAGSFAAAWAAPRRAERSPDRGADPSAERERPPSGRRDAAPAPAPEPTRAPEPDPAPPQAHEVDNVYIADPAAHASAPEGANGSDAPVGNTLAHLARLLGDEHRRGDRAPRPAPMSIRSDEIAHLQVSDTAIPEVKSGRMQALKRPNDGAEELWVQDDLDRAIEQGVDSDPAVAMRAPEDAPPMAEAAAAAAAAALRRPSEARSLGDAFALVADHLRAVSDAEDVFIADAEGLVLANTGADEPLVATTPLLRFATWRLMPWLHIDGAPIDRLSLALGDGRALALHWVVLSEETAVVVGVVLKRSAIDSTHATLHKMLDADFAARWDL